MSFFHTKAGDYATNTLIGGSCPYEVRHQHSSGSGKHFTSWRGNRSSTAKELFMSQHRIWSGSQQTTYELWN